MYEMHDVILIFFFFYPHDNFYEYSQKNTVTEPMIKSSREWLTNTERMKNKKELQN